MQHPRILTIISVAVQVLPEVASWENIAGYAPGSKVTSHNAIDLDQKAIENALSESTINYGLVVNLYQSGGNSKPYAEFTVPALTSSLSKGNAVVGATSNAQGTMYKGYSAGATSIKVAYFISDVQSTYVGCKIGSLESVPSGTTAGATQPYQLTSGCFASVENLTITTSGGNVTVTPSAGPTNKAGRTLQGFSTKAAGTMYTVGTNGGCAGASDRSTDGCPYLDYSMYYDYYGIVDYADNFVLAAGQGVATGFTNSAANMDFSGKSDAMKKECIKKGTAYMNAYMYAIREFEDAIDDCKAGCVGGINGTGANCNSLSTAAVHAWDEGVAFYTGSREGQTSGGNSAGVLSYRLAEKRCANFKTCGSNYDELTGTSYVNTELFRLLALGNYYILSGQCEATRPILRQMVALMATPLIQGTLRYAYKLDRASGGDKERGEGAVFAAAIVPRVNYCSAADAATIMSNMKVGATSTNFTAVKIAFENNYACMNITCAQVGGIWYTAQSQYYTDAEPCEWTDPSAVQGIKPSANAAFRTLSFNPFSVAMAILAILAFCSS